jgi:succinyl-CoA synthetase beta subunit
VARLHEYQGKALLAQEGIAIPRGEVIRSAAEARAAAGRLLNAGASRVILKVQAWVTGRKAKGGVLFASTAEEAFAQAHQLLGMSFGNFPVTEVLIEEAIDIQNEMFVSLTIDDAAQAPVLLLDFHGGSGIEDRAAKVARLPVDPTLGIDVDALRTIMDKSPMDRALHNQAAQTISTLVNMARKYEARSLEVNPLVITRQGRIVAADCRITIDDYAVFRHPELGIEIARELDHPPTELERIAYRVEEADHRGTFYFAQLPTDSMRKSRGLIGFHGAGGGGSMMSMDAVTSAGFTLANFCDTSGNPSAAKVYRAARIVLQQPNIVGYFGSGSGVASQEQFHSAYGLAKAFVELKLDIPAVIRLGGNSEDRAVDILQSAARLAGASIEGYKKDDTPAYCAERLVKLVEKNWARPWRPRQRALPEFVGQGYHFPINGGAVWIDHVRCDPTITEFVIEHSSGLLKKENGLPVLAVSKEDAAGKDSEFIALEMECRRAGMRVVYVDLPIPGIDS